MTARHPGSVLILEDEALVALLLEDLVRDMGAHTIDVFAAAGDALAALATREYDCAVLDLFVRDGSSLPVADALAARDIPFLFSSAADTEALASRHRSRAFLAKPFDDAAARARILDLMSGCDGPANRVAPFEPTY